MGVLLLLLPLACAPDPGKAAATKYVNDLEPLLLENSALAEQMLLQAAAVYNEAVTPDDIAVAWDAKIVPVAEHLADQAEFVAAPGEYSVDHARLVEIWRERANAYRTLSEASHTADAPAWNNARVAADQVKNKETTWFNNLNARLNGYGIVVDPYP